MRIRQISLLCGLAVLSATASAQIAPVSRSSHLRSEYSEFNFPLNGPSYVFDQTYTAWTSEQNGDNNLIRENVALSNSQIYVNSFCFGSSDSNPRQQWFWDKSARYEGNFTFDVQNSIQYNLDIVISRVGGTGLVTLFDDITNTSLYSAGALADLGTTHYTTSGTFGPGRYRLHVEGFGPSAGALGDGTIESTTNLTFVPTPGVGAMLAAAGLFGLRRRR